jgi:hypothetical protein
MGGQAPPALEATFVVVLLGMTVLLFAVAFLAFKTASTMEAWRRYVRGASVAALSLGGLCLAFALFEIVFRVLIPGGYFRAKPHRATPADAIVETLPDGQAWWEYRGANGFDEKGYRGEFVTPREDALRLVVLGDSVTYGVFLPYEDTFVYMMSEALGKKCGPVQFFDVATPGYSTLQERISLERKGLSVKPQVVFLGVFSNDLAQFTVIGSTAYDMRIKDHDGVPIFSLLPLPDSLNAFLVTNSVFYQYLTLKGMAAFDEARDVGTGQVAASLAEFEKIRKLCHDAGATLAMALFPPLHQSLSEPEERSTSFYYDEVRRWAGDNSVPFIDMRQPLAAYDLEEIRYDECCHYSPAGHEAVTGILTEWLLKSAIPGGRCRD